jgi:NAD(P)H dehydrogenase (quinone)
VIEIFRLRKKGINTHPNLFAGTTRRFDLEPDLEESWQKILRAEHLVWIHPLWWGGIPAIMKGFIDRIFLAGRAFAYRPNSICRGMVRGVIFLEIS